MIEFKFLIPTLKAWLGAGWNYGFTSQQDSYPTLEYHCPFCGKDSGPWVASIAGFAGHVPKVTCCDKSVPYPDEPKFAAHLKALPKFHDGKGPQEQYIDTWEGGFDGKFEYEKSAPYIGAFK